MASGPDLFVVCRSCGREVSPYITEGPYCGNRLRKRAPKLERGGTPKPPKAPRRRPSLGRLKPGEMPGIRGERRPQSWCRGCRSQHLPPLSTLPSASATAPAAPGAQSSTAPAVHASEDSASTTSSTEGWLFPPETLVSKRE